MKTKNTMLILTLLMVSMSILTTSAYADRQNTNTEHNILVVFSSSSGPGFNPNSLNITTGTTVTWINKDNILKNTEQAT